MTEAQYELASLIFKAIIKLGQRLDKVSSMTDDECRAVIPQVQETIDKNDEIIQGL